MSKSHRNTSKYVNTVKLQRDITRSTCDKRPPYGKILILVMIVINIGILMYPVKDSPEKVLVSLEYRFFFFFKIGIPNKSIGP